jgi:hypothetical protein
MNRKSLWIVGLVAIVLVIALPVALFWPRAQATAAKSSDPWESVPVHATHTEHTNIITGTFNSPQAVTQACLECHPEASDEVMHTTHWTWESEPMTVTWRSEPVTIGKKNQINNFCIGIQGNWKKCTSCHAGYGWSDANRESDIALLDAAAMQTLLNGGSVYGLPQANMPAGSPVIAVYRY